MTQPASTPLNPLTTLPRLRRLLAKTAKHPDAGAVHHLRTTIRRAEALLQQAPEPDAKLANRLGRLRKRAGKTRDMDVQADLVRGLHLGSDGGRRQTLIEVLESRRHKRVMKLTSELGEKRRRDLNQRLRRVELALAEAPPRTAPATVVTGVLRGFRELQSNYVALSPQNLHSFRTACKRLRYRAEMALPNPAATALVDQLRQVQDAVGNWHDWSELTMLAVKELGTDNGGALVAVLRATTDAQWHQALRVCLQVRAQLLGSRPAASPGRRPPVTAGLRPLHRAAG